MKISNSKKELARIISENGGWRDGAGYLAMDTSGMVCGYLSAPKWSSSLREWTGSACFRIFISTTLAPNHQRTILSRAEYFHLYPAPEIAPEPVVEIKPSVEQLAADYRNKLDYANRKQDEADKANMESDAALSQLEDAIAAIGFVITPLAATEQEPELVITDWRDLRVGDEVECVDYDTEHWFGVVRSIDKRAASQWVEVLHPNMDVSWPSNWRFIRRP